MERVQKLISDKGYLSRRKAEDYIKRGLVKVNGKVIGIGDKASINDVIEVDGVILEDIEKMYLMFNKKQRSSLTNINALNLPIEINKNLKVLNNLDYKEEGLVFLTNDSNLINKFNKSNRKYNALYSISFLDKLEQKDITKLIKGISYNDEVVKFNIIKIAFNKKTNTSILDVGLNIKKNINVYNMLKTIGIKIKKCKRLQIDGIKLDSNLRYLKPHEVKILFSL